MDVNGQGQHLFVCVLSRHVIYLWGSLSLYLLLRPGVLTTWLEMTLYTCTIREGGVEVFQHILIKVGRFNHRLISIGEERRAVECRGKESGAWRLKQPGSFLKVPHSTPSLSGFSQTPPKLSITLIDCASFTPPRRFTIHRLFLFPWIPPSLTFSILGAQWDVVVSCGRGHRKGTSLSLDVCLRCHFREIWASLWWPVASPQGICADTVSLPHKEIQAPCIWTRGIFQFNSFNVLIKYS